MARHPVVHHSAAAPAPAADPPAAPADPPLPTPTITVSGNSLSYQFNQVIAFIGDNNTFGLSRSGGDTVLAEGTNQLFSANECSTGNTLMDVGHNLSVDVMTATNILSIMGAQNDPGFTIDLLPFQSVTVTPDGTGGQFVESVTGTKIFDLVADLKPPHIVGGLTS